jgi:hypothetical protein
MKKYFLTLVASFMTVIAFAQLKQPQVVSEILTGVKPAMQHTVNPMKFTGKIQAPVKKQTTRRAVSRRVSAADLEGEYIACTYQFVTEKNETTGAYELVPSTISRKGITARIEVTGENTIAIYGINTNALASETKIDATVNDNGSITIAAGQTIWSHNTYGDFIMGNCSGENITDAFTGTAYDDGSIGIDQLWAEFYGTGDEQGINGSICQTFLAPVNGTMSYETDEINETTGAKTGERVKIDQNCFISQSEDAKTVTVWNFHNFTLGEVVDIAIEPDKTFSIAGGEQMVYYHSQYGYFPLWGLNGNSLDDLTGKVEGAQLKAEMGLAYYISGLGGFPFPNDIFTIDLTDGTEFAVPEAETGELVTLPEGLTATEYPFSYSLYVGGERQDITSKAKVAKSENDIYFQGLDVYIPEAWVKGTYDAEKGTVTIPVTYTGAYNGAPHFFAGYGGENGPKELVLDYDADADTYSYSATIMIYKGSTTTSYAYFYNGLFLGTKPSPVTPPAGLQTVDMPLKGNYFDGDAENPVEKTGTVKVGRDGDDLYIQNLFADKVEGGWVKGTFTTTENGQYVVFPMNQYVGDLSNGLSAYLTGYYQENESAEGSVSDVIFSYTNDGTYEYYMALNPVILTRFKNSINSVSFWQAGMTIGDAPTGINALSADKVQKSDGAWYTIGGQRVAQPTQKGLYIHNGKKIVIK